jgi:hypothetical protein
MKHIQVPTSLFSGSLGGPASLPESQFPHFQNGGISKQQALRMVVTFGTMSCPDEDSWPIIANILWKCRKGKEGWFFFSSELSVVTRGNNFVH